MRTVILYKDDFKTESNGYHIDAWKEMILDPFGLDDNTTQVEMSVEKIDVLAKTEDDDN